MKVGLWWCQDLEWRIFSFAISQCEVRHTVGPILFRRRRGILRIHAGAWVRCHKMARGIQEEVVRREPVDDVKVYLPFNGWKKPEDNFSAVMTWMIQFYLKISFKVQYQVLVPVLDWDNAHTLNILYIFWANFQVSILKGILVKPDDRNPCALPSCELYNTIGENFKLMLKYQSKVKSPVWRWRWTDVIWWIRHCVGTFR